MQIWLFLSPIAYAATRVPEQYRWLYDLLSPLGTVLVAHPLRLRAMVQRRAKTDRLDAGNGRSRKVGVVAVARKLLIALWKYVEQGDVPAGARLVAWQGKVKGCPKSSAA